MTYEVRALSQSLLGREACGSDESAVVLEGGVVGGPGGCAAGRDGDPREGLLKRGPRVGASVTLRGGVPRRPWKHGPAGDGGGGGVQGFF